MHVTKLLLLLTGLLLMQDAHALRCGNKLVRDGMHEAEVLAICGEPTLRRDIGHALRGGGIRQGHAGYRYRLPGRFLSEVIVTEYVYNFGPRRLMRRLVFEGGLLVKIERIGYGYIEK
ncbi:MAG: DUF2845 domain-containing protein [Pseudomonadota bacterium]